jgi:hypothetical protein
MNYHPFQGSVTLQLLLESWAPTSYCTFASIPIYAAQYYQLAKAKQKDVPKKPVLEKVEVPLLRVHTDISQIKVLDEGGNEVTQ